MSNQPQLNRDIQAVTRRGTIHGKCVGFEHRDVTRGGSGRTTPLVCIRPDDGSAWQWVPQRDVQEVTA